MEPTTYYGEQAEMWGRETRLSIAEAVKYGEASMESAVARCARLAAHFAACVLQEWEAQDHYDAAYDAQSY